VREALDADPAVVLETALLQFMAVAVFSDAAAAFTGDTAIIVISLHSSMIH
jgi:hypothetical protein